MSLTGEDKQWIGEQLTSLGTRLEAKIQGVETRLEGVETGLNAKIDGVEKRLEEKMFAMETTLLTEFHKWAVPNELRQRSFLSSFRAVEAEMQALTDRVAKLEKKN